MKNFVMILFLSFFSLLNAQNFGEIKGKVVDAASGELLIGANVIIEGTQLGSASDVNGKFIIKKVPSGVYTMSATYIGYNKVIKDSVTVESGKSTIVNFEMQVLKINGEAISIIVEAKGTISAINQQLSSNTIVNMVSSARLASEGNTKHNTEEYSRINENDLKTVIKEPVSTFSIDVDAASYSNSRRFIMMNKLPYKDAVRVEEFINYFDYDYEQPTDAAPFKTNIEYSECPWDSAKKLLRIGLQAKKLKVDEKIANNLVFLLDVSGSMDSPEKLPLLKSAFKMLVKSLKPEDKISIVVYAGAAGLVLPPTSGENKSVLLKAIEKLRAAGSTAGGEGIKLAYKVAKENFIKGGNNRIILATDGDFNVGVSSTSELVDYVDEQKESGVFLTVLGFGMGNYKDDRLQEISDRGNGNHYYIDNILEAKKVIVNQLNSTLFTVAKDVKIQVEFNPVKVGAYRLVGYENRLLNTDDFVDDKKDAGEIGAGHTVTALYEIIPNESDEEMEYDLKYQKLVVKEEAYDTDEICTVKIRYKKPDEDVSTEMSETFDGDCEKFSESSDNFRFASAVAEFGLILRNSDYKGTANCQDVINIAENSMGNDEYGYRKEFIDLVKRAELLMETESKPDEG